MIVWVANKGTLYAPYSCMSYYSEQNAIYRFVGHMNRKHKQKKDWGYYFSFGWRIAAFTETKLTVRETMLAVNAIEFVRLNTVVPSETLTELESIIAKLRDGGV